jgi:aerobic-type carbon monoxide dehydrogenase small subunit (CoxS/CutS family)
MPASGLIRLRFTLNGEEVAVQCQPGTRLLELLREEFQLHGAREGCGRGECGSCLVLMDGRAVNSCLVPAFILADSEIVTSEGLAQLKSYADLRKALGALDASGCGFCESGLKIALAALLLSDPQPREEEVRRALSGNFCGCGLHGVAAGREWASGAGSDRLAGRQGRRRRHGRR